MKFNINRKDLIDALKVVVPATGNIAPMLKCVLIECADDVAKFTCCDTEKWIVTRAKANIEITGSAVVNVSQLMRIASSLSMDNVYLELIEGKRLKLECGTAKIQLNAVYKAEEFPRCEFIGGDNETTELTENIKKMFKAVQYAVGSDDSRKALTGVKFEVAHDETTAVATDSRKLAVCILPSASENAIDVVIPVNAVNAIFALNDTYTSIQVSNTGKMLRLSDTKTEIFTKLISETYPNWRKIVPTGHTYDAKICTETFLKKLQVLSVIDDLKTVDLTFSENTLKLNAVNAECGSGSDEFQIELETSEPVKMCMSSKFLTQALKTCNSEFFDFGFNAEPSPCKLDFGNGCYCVIMPIRKRG